MTTRQFITAVLGLALMSGAASAQPADPQDASPNPAAALRAVDLPDDAPDQEAAAAQVGEDAQPAAPLAPMPLFAEARNLALPQAVEGWATSARPILLDEAALLRFDIGTQFVLDLEPGVSFVSSVERVDRTGERRMTLGGAVLGTPDGTFAFAVYDDAVAMVVRVPSQQRVYRLQFMGGGAYWVSRINEILLPECSGALAAPPEPPRVLEPDDDDYLPPDGEPGYGEAAGGGCTAGTPIFDTMVVYTPAARTAAGGHAAIRAEAALAIDETNVAYPNSLITARARLVYCNEVTYTESGDRELDLNRLSGILDGFMDGVHATRDSVNADLVALFYTGGGGIAWCQADYGGAFSVTNWSSAAAGLVHAHETGHNLGCAHDRQNVDCGPSYTYGYGWRFNGTDGVQYRTVMAYAPGTRVAHFSNPNVTFQGTATGVPIGQVNEAYNAQVINNRDTTIDGFELTRYDIYVNFAYGGFFEFGTYALPYDTVPEGVAAISVPSTGAVEYPNLYVRTGTTTWTGTISKKMQINACGGTVRIGG